MLAALQRRRQSHQKDMEDAANMTDNYDSIERMSKMQARKIIGKLPIFDSMLPKYAEPSRMLIEDSYVGLGTSMWNLGRYLYEANKLFGVEGDAREIPVLCFGQNLPKRFGKQFRMN